MAGVQRFGQRASFITATLLALLGAIPSAHAAPFDGISRAMGTAWSAIGSVFSFNIAPGLQEGVLKFLIFILILRVIMGALEKTGPDKWYGDRKTAGIIGFVVAAVTVFFTPNVFIFSAIILLLVPVLLAIVAYYYVFRKTPAMAPGYAALILFVLLTLLEFLNESVYVQGNIAIGNMYPFTSAVMNLLIVVTGILFVWKLFAMIFAIGGGLAGGEGITGALKRAGDIADAAGDLNKKLHAPGQVSGLSVELVPGSTPARVKVSWTANPGHENVMDYIVEWTHGLSWFTANWIRAGRTSETQLEIANVDIARKMLVRVCARNKLGRLGPWARAIRVLPGENGPERFASELADARRGLDEATARMQTAERSLARDIGVIALGSDGRVTLGTHKLFTSGSPEATALNAIDSDVSDATRLLNNARNALDTISNSREFRAINNGELNTYTSLLGRLRRDHLRLYLLMRGRSLAAVAP